MRKKILKILKQKFPQYNDYKLGKVADSIIAELHLEMPHIVPLKSCIDCIYFNTLIVTYVGRTPNLCQRGRPKGDAMNCPYYTERGNSPYYTERGDMYDRYSISKKNV